MSNIDLLKKQLIQLTVEDLDKIIDEVKSEQNVSNKKAIDLVNIKKNNGTKYWSTAAVLFLLENPDCNGYSIPIEDDGMVVKSVDCI